MNITRRMVGGTDLTQSLDPLGPRTVEAVETMSPVPPRWRRGMLVALLAAAGGLAAAQLALGQADLPVAWLAAVPLVASVTLSIKATSAAAAEALALAALVQFFGDTGSRGDPNGLGGPRRVCCARSPLSTHSCGHWPPRAWNGCRR